MVVGDSDRGPGGGARDTARRFVCCHADVAFPLRRVEPVKRDGTGGFNRADEISAGGWKGNANKTGDSGGNGDSASLTIDELEKQAYSEHQSSGKLPPPI